MCLIENVDFSNFGAAVDLVSAPQSARAPYVIRNCKLPASWSGNLMNTATFGGLVPGAEISMYNCAAGAVNYAMWLERYAGTIKHEATLVRTGGASDGVTPLSWKMVSNANAGYPTSILYSPDIFPPYNSTTGSSKTLTVEILRDSATNLKDNEVWLEVSYLGSSGQPLGTLITDATADLVTTAADQTTSSVTWTTTGMSNPNKQSLSVTFTPQMAGFFICRVALAKASTTIYVDPKVTVT
jgi:hypothetical protein